MDPLSDGANLQEQDEGKQANRQKTTCRFNFFPNVLVSNMTSALCLSAGSMFRQHLILDGVQRTCMGIKHLKRKHPREKSVTI